MLALEFEDNYYYAQKQFHVSIQEDYTRLQGKDSFKSIISLMECISHVMLNRIQYRHSLHLNWLTKFQKTHVVKWKSSMAIHTTQIGKRIRI